jgi:catechol 2,3-dioxygenase-like lactoylglutathione lyase family enzyme
MNLNQVTMSTEDIEQSKRFYQKMGFNLIVDTPHYLRFECPQGATFSLNLVDQFQGPNGTTVYFEFDSKEALDEKIKALEADGFEILEQPHDARYLWRVSYIADPSGNRLCLYHGGEARLNPPWRVN